MAAITATVGVMLAWSAVRISSITIKENADYEKEGMMPAGIVGLGVGMAKTMTGHGS